MTIPVPGEPEGVWEKLGGQVWAGYVTQHKSPDLGCGRMCGLEPPSSATCLMVAVVSVRAGEQGSRTTGWVGSVPTVDRVRVYLGPHGSSLAHSPSLSWFLPVILSLA